MKKSHLTVAGLIFVAGGALADEMSIETVVVTAQKREEKVQNVPLAVQVISAPQLQAAGIQNFVDLTRLSPNLIVRNDLQPVNATVSIRGIGTNAFGIGVEPSVAVQIDDVPIAFQARAFSELVDIDRVEILAGPQSTLYGKSASAGLINIVTASPTADYYGRLDILGTTDKEVDLNVVLSGPITSNAGVRVVVGYDDYPGNIDNIYYNHKINGGWTFFTRGKFDWDPTANFSVRLGLNYIESDTTFGRPFINVAPNANLRANPNWPPSVWGPGIVFGPDNLVVDNNYETGYTTLGTDESLRLAYDLGGPTLMSITSHAKFIMDDTQDSDESGLAAIDNRQTGNFINTQWTEELRLVSPGGDRFRYTLGAFYADVDYIRHFQRGPFFSLARWDATEGSEQESVFGQIEYDLLPKLTLIGGARGGQERINYTFLDYLAGPTFYSGHNNDKYATYKAGLNYHLTDDVMLFTSTATGHKGPTYDLTTGFNRNRALGGPVHPETSTDYEVGARTQFLDHRLTLNSTLFHTDYKNLQAQGIQVLPDGTTNFRLANVGTATIQGGELDAAYRATADLNLIGNIAYLDAKITSFPDAQCYPLQTAATGCTGSPGHQNLSNRPLPQAPKFKLAAAFDYTHELGMGGLEGILRGSYTWQTKENYALTQDPQTLQKAYGILNVSFGARDPQKHYEVVIFVNNLTDQRYYGSLVDSASQYGNNVALQAVIPRDFHRYAGIRLSAWY